MTHSDHHHGPRVYGSTASASAILPSGFDAAVEHIVFVFDRADIELNHEPRYPTALRHVKIVRPIQPRPSQAEMREWCGQAGSEAWRLRYGESMPVPQLEFMWADCLAARAIPYDGPTALSDVEQTIVYDEDFGDLTVALLYVIVEVFGWRPGAWIANGGLLPDREAMRRFYDYFHQGAFAEGALTIALSMYATGPCHQYYVAWEEIEAAATMAAAGSPCRNAEQV